VVADGYHPLLKASDACSILSLNHLAILAVLTTAISEVRRCWLWLRASANLLIVFLALGLSVALASAHLRGCLLDLLNITSIMLPT